MARIYKNDLRKAEVQLNQAILILDLHSANDALLISKLRFAQLIGLGATSDFNIQDSIIVSELTDGENSAYERDEVELLKTDISLSEDQKNLMIADGQPVLSMSINGLGAVGEAGINPSVDGKTLASYYGMINLSVPIFGWGVRKGKIKEQSHRIEAKKFDLRQSSELITLESKNARIKVKLSVQKLALSKTSLQQADENLRLFNNVLKRVR